MMHNARGGEGEPLLLGTVLDGGGFRATICYAPSGDDLGHVLKVLSDTVNVEVLTPRRRHPNLVSIYSETVHFCYSSTF